MFQLVSTNLHKIYMAREASPMIILFCPVCKTKWLLYHMFNVKWGYAIRRPYISLTIAPTGLGCENNFWEV